MPRTETGRHASARNKVAEQVENDIAFPVLETLVDGTVGAL